MHKCCKQLAENVCALKKQERDFDCPIPYNSFTEELSDTCQKWTVNTHLFRCFSEMSLCFLILGA